MDQPILPHDNVEPYDFEADWVPRIHLSAKYYALYLHKWVDTVMLFPDDKYTDFAKTGDDWEENKLSGPNGPPKYYSLLILNVTGEEVLVCPCDNALNRLPGYRARWFWSKYLAILDMRQSPRANSTLVLPKGLEPGSL